MTEVGAQQQEHTRCPGCGDAEVLTVEKARGGKGAMRKDLFSRLAQEPDTFGDGCLHFVEGLLLAGALGGGLAYMGMEQSKGVYFYGGLVLAALIMVVTLRVVQDDGRAKAAVEAGQSRADRLWDPAHYCDGCESVFCPGGVPWQGLLTPEQFKKFVWTEAGYADLLAVGDKAKDAEVPELTTP